MNYGRTREMEAAEHSLMQIKLFVIACLNHPGAVNSHNPCELTAFHCNELVIDTMNGFASCSTITHFFVYLRKMSFFG